MELLNYEQLLNASQKIVQPEGGQLAFFTQKKLQQLSRKPKFHQALDCYHRMDFAYQGRHPPSQLAAMAATTHSATELEQPWYFDSNANHHITPKLENLTLQQPYQGTETVTVGNGGGLQIANTSSSTLHFQ
jgi:hypothetical protein